MRTTVTIDDTLLAEAKLIAARTHRTIGAVLEEALRRLIDDQRGRGARSPFALPSYDVEHPGLQPGVDLLDADHMAEILGDNAEHVLP